jgi:Tfp pilus assembly protein PilF
MSIACDRSGADMIGKTVLHYRIISKLGAGGMGVVYKAEDLKLRRLVALKFLTEETTRDPEIKRRFLNEARAASALDHPNICSVHEINETSDGRVFMVMAYYTGQVLNERIRQGPLPILEALRITMQIAEGLVKAHQKGIIHRDIKPGNILLSEDGLIKILDFGLAKLAGGSVLTREGKLLGTVAYMSPEQAWGKAADHRTDIWSLGVVLYEMLAGRPPFAGEYPQSIIYGIQNETPAPMTSLRSGVPLQLEHILGKTLAKAAAERYQSLDDLLVDLRAVQKALLSPAPAAVSTPATGQRPPASQTEVLKQPVGRLRRRLTLAAGSVAVMILVALVWFQPWRSQEAGRGKNSPATGLLAAKKASANKEANEYFERGLFFMTSQLDLTRARQMLEHALALDATFAEARAWYGFTSLLMIDSGKSNDSKWIYQAEAELRQALKDNPNSARAHSALAAVYFYSGRKELERKEAEKALELSPDDMDAKNWLGNYFLLNGDYATAHKLFISMLERNPLFFPPRMNVGEIYRLQGNFAAAVREQKKVLEQDPKNIYASEKLAKTFIAANELPLARMTLERLTAADRQNYSIKIAWALVLIAEGKKAEAIREMDSETLKYASIAALSTLEVAEFYALAGNSAAALEWLERAVRNGDERVDWFQRDPNLKSIRALPRFQQIIDSITFRRRTESGKETGAGA